MNIRSFLHRAPITKVGIGVLLSVIAFGCIKTPLDPILPASDIQMSIPIINRTRTVVDMFGKDTSKIKSNAAGFYYQDVQPSKPTPIDSIKLSPQATGIQATVGTVTIPGVAPTTQSSDVSALGITPLILPVGTIPGTTKTIPSSQIDQSASINFVAVKNGTLTLTVANNLPVSISFPNGITLRNNKTTSPVDTNIVAVFAFPTIPRRSSSTQNADLAGKTLRGFLKTDPVTINTGSMTGPDTIKSTDGISFTFSSSTLSTDTVSAVIPNQTLTSFSDSVVTLDPTAVLQKATFNSGQFGLNINNQTGLVVGAQLEFYNFVSTKPSLDTLIIDRLVNPHTQYQLNVNLDTIQIVNGDQTRPGTTMRFSVKIRTVNSGGVIPTSTITSSDFVSAAFTPLQPFAVKSLTGIMNPMTLAVNTGASGLNLGDATTRLAISSVTFDSVRMALKLGLSSGFPIAYNLSIIAMNRKVVPYKVDSIAVPQPVGSTTIQPGLNNFAQIVLNNSTGLSTFLGKFFPNFPDTFIVRGSATINPNPPTSGVVYDTTKVYSAISTYFPLKLGILDGEYTDVANISGSFDSTFVTDVKSGSMSFSITNALPLALNFRASFMGIDTLTHMRDTLLTLPSGGNVYTIAGAQVNSSGTVSAPTQSTFKIGLVTPEILALAASDSVYIKLTLNTSGSAGPPVQAVRINANDYITIRASANMVYTVNKKH